MNALQGRNALIAGIVIAAIVFFFVGRHFGYNDGFNVAYTAEHSHYLFEKSRGDSMQKRIDTQKACIYGVVRQLSPIADGGFAGLGEMLANIKTLTSGTLGCDREAGFGAITADQAQTYLTTPEQ